MWTKFASVCLMDNLVSLIVPDLKVRHRHRHRLPHFTSKLTNVVTNVFNRVIFKHMPNLKSLELDYCELDIHQDDFPVTLEELTFVQTNGEHIWRNLSPPLKKLTLKSIESSLDFQEFHFPEGLVELDFDFVDFRDFPEDDIRFPPTLKKLLLNCRNIGSPRSFEFPSGIESLSLEIFEWDLLEPIIFEYGLKELTLHVDNVEDSFVACERLPETLEYLDIANIECPPLPQGLKVFKIETLERLSHFPPNLEQLDYSVFSQDFYLW